MEMQRPSTTQPNQKKKKKKKKIKKFPFKDRNKKYFILNASVELGSLYFHLLLYLETGTLLSDLAVMFLALYSNVFHTQLAFVFHFQKKFYIVHNNILVMKPSSVRF